MSQQPEVSSGRRQIRVLYGTFLARFFEHESTAGRTDLRESFFWLIGAIGAPGLMFAFYQHFDWQAAVLRPDGAARLRLDVLFDKTIYLTFTSVVMGLVSVAVWNALIVDRRDVLVLGVLPVRRREIVAAKLLSLAAYVGALNLGMHAGAALLFGGFLGGAESLTSIPREVAAHMIASSAVGMFVFLSVVALESACLTMVGPRQFARAAAALQVVLISLFTVTLLMIPAIAAGAASLPHPGSTWWLAYVPPIWFLGLYEALAGTSVVTMSDLAQTAIVAFMVAVVAVLAFYPVACWRVLTSAVTAGGSATLPWNRLIGARVVDLLAVGTATRAALQFLIATAGRVGRFRMVMSAAIGLGIAMVAPVILYLMARGVPARPALPLLAAPLLLTATLVAGWRIIIAMPSELPARWVFRATQMDPFEGRIAVRRLMFTAGVLIPLTLFAPAWIVFWGVAASWLFVVNALFAGGILVEAHLWGFAGMPCSRPMAVSESNLQGRWPFYGIGLLAYALAIPAIGVEAAGSFSEWLVAVALGVIYVTVRSMSNEAARVNVITDDHRGLIMLDLAMVPPAAAGTTRAPRVLLPGDLSKEGPHA